MQTKSLIAILLLLVSFVVGYWLVWPDYKRIDSTKVIINEKQNKVDSLKDDLKQMQDAVLRLKDPAVQKIKLAVPNGSSKFSLTLEMQTLAASTGMVFKSLDITEEKPAVGSNLNVRVSTGEEDLKLQKINPTNTQSSSASPSGASGGASTPTTAYQTLGLKINVSGNYEILKKFLNALENEQRLIDVKSFNYSASAKKSSESSSNSSGSTANANVAPDVSDFTIEAKAYYVTPQK